MGAKGVEQRRVSPEVVYRGEDIATVNQSKSRIARPPRALPGTSKPSVQVQNPTFRTWTLDREMADDKDREKSDRGEEKAEDNENQGSVSDVGEWEPDLGEEEQDLPPRQATPEGADNVFQCCECAPAQNSIIRVEDDGVGLCPWCGHQKCDGCKEGKDSFMV
ncbi:hypothetical protein VTK26DRAFT_5400 [Humicola hyalothermophila]